MPHKGRYRQAGNLTCSSSDCGNELPDARRVLCDQCLNRVRTADSGRAGDLVCLGPGAASGWSIGGMGG